MDISAIVAWVQAAVWLVLGISYFARLVRGKAKMPRWLFSNKILGLAILLGLALSSYALYRDYRRPSIGIVHFSPSYTFSEVTDQKFTNERVTLDGRRFVNCTFTNVSLEWDGTAPFQMIDVNINGFWIYTNSDAVSGTVMLLKATHMLKDDVPIYKGPQQTPIEMK